MSSGQTKFNPTFISEIGFETFINQLKRRLELPLPGISAQLKLAPAIRRKEIQLEPPPNAIQSSVLILLYPVANKTFTNVILRAEYDGVHSGQISFPGGRKEQHDKNHAETALREAHEETGIEISNVNLIGSLSRLYIDRSNFVVFPYIGYSLQRPDFKPDPVEVQQILEFNIETTFNRDALVHKNLLLNNGFSIKAPGFEIGNHFMWGATAMIYSEFLEVIHSIIVK